MKNVAYQKVVLDNMPDGAYLLDDRGNYVLVNQSYINLLKIPENEILNYNVKDFLKTRQINFCISDLVYREKRNVTMFQDVYDTLNVGRGRFRLLVTSTPIFDENGEISNILAIVRSLADINECYYEASKNKKISSFSPGGKLQKIEDEKTVIANSSAMQEILNLAENISNADSTILITGESGTGKEVVTQHIHDCSSRSNKQFVVVNCASLPENLLESELFGYAKGAFTGATPGGKAGLFEGANGGTLLLDEINSLPLNLQGKLLRAIETKTIQRIGATQTQAVDFRLVCATNENLEQLVVEKKFRMDLYYRLNVIPLTVPPLRERREDIIPLAFHFLQFFCKKNNKSNVFSPDTLEYMASYNWPGNVRELKNFVERSVVMSVGRMIEIQNARGIAAASPPKSLISRELQDMEHFTDDQLYEQMLANRVPLNNYLERCDRNYVQFALKKCKNTYKAAFALGTSQAAIMRRKKKYQI